MHVLPNHYDIQMAVEKLSAEVNRPVFLCAMTHKSGNFYRLPGAADYSQMSALDLALSTYTDGPCVKREPSFPGEPDNFYFDLSESTILYVAYPLTEEEARGKKEIDFQAVFGKIGMSAGLTRKSVRVGEGKIIGVHRCLNDYIVERKKVPPKGRFVYFATSEMFLRPQVRRDWHIGYKAKKFATIQGPGLYPEAFEPFSVLYDNNRFGVTNREPGECIVCRGLRKEHRHVGVVAGEYITNLVCVACARDAFGAILTLAEGN